MVLAVILGDRLPVVKCLSLPDRAPVASRVPNEKRLACAAQAQVGRVAGPSGPARRLFLVLRPEVPRHNDALTNIDNRAEEDLIHSICRHLDISTVQIEFARRGGSLAGQINLYLRLFASKSQGLANLGCSVATVSRPNPNTATNPIIDCGVLPPDLAFSDRSLKKVGVPPSATLEA
jgi:hypothetical protein